MNDTELYDFFKSKSEHFNEMPSDEMWNKISVSLNNAPQKAVSKSLVAKLFLLIATILGTTYGIVTVKDGIIQKPNPIPFKVFPAKTDSIKMEKTAEKPKQTQSKTSTVYFKKLGTVNATTAKNDTIAVKETTQLIQSLIVAGETIKTATPELMNAEKTTQGNRIIITGKPKLSKTAFDSLVNRAVELNKDEYGKLLVIKSIGNRTFIKIIQKEIVLKPGVITLKNDSIFKPSGLKTIDFIELKDLKGDSLVPNTKPKK